MRITTQMLNNTRQRAGLPINSSLVDFMQKGSSKNWKSSLNATNKVTNSLAKSKYEKLEKSSTELSEQTDKLAEKVDNGSTEIGEEAASLVDKFNETLRNLKQASGALNSYYFSSLKETATSNKDALAEIGITVAADGTLTLNKETLGSADGEKVKKLLGSAGTFATKVNFVAARVADNAAANVESASSYYSADGSLGNSYLSKYNLKG